jgi:DnaK suppressor protein
MTLDLLIGVYPRHRATTEENHAVGVETFDSAAEHGHKGLARIARAAASAALGQVEDRSRNVSGINELDAIFGLKPRNPIHILRAAFIHGVSGRPMRPSLPPGYHPSDDEEFMNPLQVEYFRQKLLHWRAQLLAESSDTLQHLKEESLLKPDLTDRASLETERAIELRTRARERKLISKIEAALNRLDDGTYGYCEETDEPIGIRRLEARPIATLSIEAQERHERMERTHRDD